MDVSSRALGCVEEVYATMDAVGLYINVIVSAHYTSARQDCSLDRTVLYSALHKVIQKHPGLWLQVRLGNRKYAVRLQEIDLDETVRYCDATAQNLEAIFVDQIASPFTLGTNKPLWRLLILLDGTIIFVAHHIFCDGRSGVNFHKSLLAALASPPASEPSHSGNLVTIPTGLWTVPYTEGAVAVKATFRTFFKILYPIVLPQQLTRKATAWTGNPVPATPQTRAVVHVRRLAAGNAATLLQLCRQHRCTLSGFFHTLGIYILSHLLNTRAKAGRISKVRYKDISAFINVDLRRFAHSLQEVDQTICNLSSGWHSYASLFRAIDISSLSANSFPWDHAAHATATFRSTALQRGKDNIAVVRTLAKFGLLKKLFSGFFGRPRQIGLEISNLGPTSALASPMSGSSEAHSTDQHWHMDELMLCADDTTIGPAMQLNIVGSPSGSVSVVYVWGEQSIDRDLGEAFVRDMEDAIAVISSGVTKET